ncbi:hypothetical protein BU26DRAFT_433024 [Trematosphaeria pertusa]|uniref:Uncharacterized protein n=1 Tax=Trematosphaeria pertusa TaxID=390896 RepID=A0A6A6I5D4_9PLEO|nr:uncharacterized protein BU26DRAFT_433024 [Trematosphaeria pertusa]KAF2245537.1 hypothetical protein BU26DRAFT_433024 [Trematosphaeria pertusa]
MFSSAAKPTGRQPRKWTVAEDQKLREEVEAQSNRTVIEGEVKDWCRIAAKLPGRTNKDCRKRWHNSVAGGLKKGQWSKSEDIQLARGVQQYGQRWTLVANVVGSRSADQCAKRWQQSLDPELDRSEWRDAEDKVLIEAVQKLGRHWKDIQRHHFPGRSKNCIKNRYTVLIRRYQNQGITLPQPAATPEPNTSNVSSYSATDDDSMSYTSSVYDDLLPTHTQVSTPETQHSWPVDEEAFTGWSSQESFNITSTAPDFSCVQQPITSNVTHSPQWSWTTTSMSQPAMMNIAPPHAYSNAMDSATLASYDAYGSIPAMLSPNSTRFPRAPTSSPRARACTTPPYQDPQAMARFMRYGIQRDPPYQY